MGTEKRTLYTSFHEMRALVAAFELQAGRTAVTSDWSKVPARAIAAINFRHKDGGKYWHSAAVCGANDSVVVCDPRSTHEQRMDFGRMRLHAYISTKPVQAPNL